MQNIWLKHIKGELLQSCRMTHKRIFESLYCLFLSSVSFIFFRLFWMCLLRLGILRVLVLFCYALCVCFVMVPLNLTYLHCLQYFFFEHLFNLYWIQRLEASILWYFKMSHNNLASRLKLTCNLLVNLGKALKNDQTAESIFIKF